MLKFKKKLYYKINTDKVLLLIINKKNLNKFNQLKTKISNLKIFKMVLIKKLIMIHLKN